MTVHDCKNTTIAQVLIGIPNDRFVVDFNFLKLKSPAKQHYNPLSDFVLQRRAVDTYYGDANVQYSIA